MTWGRRIRMYLVGLLIGIGLVAVIYGNRACSFLPGKQVLQNIRTSDIEITEQSQCYLDCYGLTQPMIFEMLEEGNGDVDFSASEPRNDPKMYVIEGTIDSKPTTVSFTTSDSISRFDAFIKMSDHEPCSCENLDNREIVDIWRHNDRILHDLNARNITMTSELQQELAEMDISDLSVYKIFDNGTVIYEESYSLRQPYPIFVIEGDIEGIPVKMMFELGPTSRLLQVQSITS